MSIFGKSDRGEADIERPLPASSGASGGTQPAPSRPTPVPSGSQSQQPATSGDMSVISRGLTIEGNLSGEDDIRVDGVVSGDIRSRTLIVSQGATVNGSVTAETIELLGNINGELDGKSVRIAGTGHLDGDVNYDTLSIESGAVVNGNLKHKSKGTASTPKAGNGAAKPAEAKSEAKNDESKSSAKPSAS